MTTILGEQVQIFNNKTEPLPVPYSIRCASLCEGRCWTWLKSLTPLEKLVLAIFVGSVITTAISVPFMNTLSSRGQTVLVVVLACGLVAPLIYGLGGIQPQENLRQLDQFPPINV